MRSSSIDTALLSREPHMKFRLALVFILISAATLGAYRLRGERTPEKGGSIKQSLESTHPFVLTDIKSVAKGKFIAPVWSPTNFEIVFTTDDRRGVYLVSLADN